MSFKIANPRCRACSRHFTIPQGAIKAFARGEREGHFASFEHLREGCCSPRCLKLAGAYQEANPKGVQPVKYEVPTDLEKIIMAPCAF